MCVCACVVEGEGTITRPSKQKKKKKVFAKPPELLARDRLLAAYEVRPVLDQLRRTLVGSGAALLAAAVVLAGAVQIGGGDAESAMMSAPRAVTADGVMYGARLQSLSQLADDDALAAEEAAAQGGVPGYCRDRLLRAYAGGQYCSKFER